MRTVINQFNSPQLLTVGVSVGEGVVGALVGSGVVGLTVG